MSGLSGVASRCLPTRERLRRARFFGKKHVNARSARSEDEHRGKVAIMVAIATRV